MTQPTLKRTGAQRQMSFACAAVATTNVEGSRMLSSRSAESSNSGPGVTPRAPALRSLPVSRLCPPGPVSGRPSRFISRGEARGTAHWHCVPRAVMRG
jgi:hypothetical protein